MSWKSSAGLLWLTIGLKECHRGAWQTSQKQLSNNGMDTITDIGYAMMKIPWLIPGSFSR